VQIDTSNGTITRLSYEALGDDRDPITGERRWLKAGDCMRPVCMPLTGRPDPVLAALGIGNPKIMFGLLYVRCRKCDTCNAARSRMWAARAIAETGCATRNWFGTLTIAPEHRVRLLYEAQLLASRRCSDWLKMKDSQRFQILGAVIGRELTLMLKRLRKRGAAFRYLLVFEAHKDGFPHVHMLVHEVGSAVAKRTLEAEWHLGFTKWKLVAREGENAHAFYVCKYIAKSALVRVRSSLGYGRSCQALASKRLLGEAIAPIRKMLALDKPPVIKGGSPKRRVL